MRQNKNGILFGTVRKRNDAGNTRDRYEPNGSIEQRSSNHRSGSRVYKSFIGLFIVGVERVIPSISLVKKMSTQTRIDFEQPKYPPTAILETVGEEIQGEIVEMGDVKLEERYANYMHIHTEEGIKTLWLGKVLNEQCEKENVKKGDYIGIKYLGEVSSGKQSPYRNYDMRVIPMTLSDKPMILSDNV